MGEIKTFFSKRIQDMSPYIPGEQIQHNAVIKLNTNENPYPPPLGFIERLREFDFGLLRLYPEPNSWKLREKIASYYGIEVENVFVGNGSDEIIRLLPLIFLDSDDKIGFFEITYSLYKTIAQMFGYKYIVFKNEDDFSINLDRVSNDVKLLFLPNPNSPTGLYISIDKIERFLESFDGILVVDEAYIDFSGKKSAISLVDRYPNLVVIRTFSKAFSLAGIRLGYCFANKDVVFALDKVRDSYNVNTFSAYCGYLIFDFMDELKEKISLIIKNREFLKDELSLMNFFIIPSFANFLFVKPPISAYKLYTLLKENNILVRYFPSPDKIKQYLRITIGREEEMHKLLYAIKKIIELE